MKNVILSSFIEVLNSEELTLGDLEYLFSNNFMLHEDIFNEYISIPVMYHENKNIYTSPTPEIETSNYYERKSLELPLLYYYFLIIKDKSVLIEKTFELIGDKIDFFKEVWIKDINSSRDIYHHRLHRENKTLVPSINLYEILNRFFKNKNIETFNKFNTKTIEQYSNLIYFLQKNKIILNTEKEQKIYTDYSRFKLTYENLYLHNRNMSDNLKSENFFDFKLAGVIQSLPVITCNINSMSHQGFLYIEKLIQNKVINDELTFDWTFEKFINYITNNKRANFLEEFIDKVLIKHNDFYTSEFLSAVFVTNKSIFTKYKNNYHDLKGVNFMSQEMIENNNDFTKNVTECLNTLLNVLDDKFKNNFGNEIEITNIMYKLREGLLYLLKENAILYFNENIEDRIVVENSVSTYIPKILDRYLEIPMHLRNNSESKFLSLTLEQLEKISAEIESIQMKVLENNLKDMKVYNDFLENRLSKKESIKKENIKKENIINISII